jgi:predicted phage tail protein
MILRGNKGGGSGSTPTRTPDNLRSEDTVEILLGVSEGEIKGLKDQDARNLFVSDTPLLNADGDLNIGDFEALLFPGSALDETIKPALGGQSSSTSVGIQLANQTAVTRTTQQNNIDYIELRFNVTSLYRQTEEGDVLNNTLRMLVEYKPSNETNWQKAFLTYQSGQVQQIGLSSSSFIRYSGAEAEFNDPRTDNGDPPFDRDTRGIADRGATPPSEPIPNQIWIDDATQNKRIMQWDGGAWQQLSQQPVPDTDWDFSYSGQTVQVYDAPPASTIGPQSTPGTINNSSAIAIPTTGQPEYWGGGAFYQGLRSDEVRERGFYGYSPASNSANLVINGKTTSPYVKEVRIPVDRIAETYDIRVTKLSIDPGQGGDQENVIDVTWESFQEVIAGNFSFPNTAILQIVGRASDQLNGFPQVSGIYDGMIVRVPSNYDPVARTYSGLWDGTWKLEFTNNPAFLWNELQLNTVWGRSAYYPVIPNKWDVYEAGKYCDEMVDNGQGGQQPRWTFNQWITDAQGVKKLGLYMAGVFGGVFSDDGSGQVFLRVDKDKPASGIITPEVVSEQGIMYTRTDLDQRYNDITVSFKDPELNYNENRLRVIDPVHVAKYGRKPYDMIAFGCRNRQEAKRRGRKFLADATREVTTAQLSMNRMAFCYDLYDIVLIADPKLGTGITGRVSQFLNADKTQWRLRDSVYLEPGVTYYVNTQIPNPNYGPNDTEAFQTIRVPLTAGHTDGEVTVLNLDSAALTTLPDYAWFALEADGYAGIPKPFRIMGMEAEDGDADKISLTLKEVDRTKFSYIDTGDSSELIEYSAFNSEEVKKPTNLQFVNMTRNVGGQQVDVIGLQWDRSPSKSTRRYKVHYVRNGGEKVLITETQDTFAELFNPPTGDFEFQIRAVSISGIESNPLVRTYRHAGDRRPVEDPSDFSIQNGPTDAQFAEPSAVVIWD